MPDLLGPDGEKQLASDLLGLLPITGIGNEENDTMVISFRASDGELESVIEAIKRLRGVLEVDRA